MLESWQKRVLDERDESTEKCRELEELINDHYHGLPMSERNLIHAQLHIMRAYRNVLSDRIVSWSL